jgi:hypothetical protein
MKIDRYKTQSPRFERFCDRHAALIVVGIVIAACWLLWGM